MSALQSEVTPTIPGQRPFSHDADVPAYDAAVASLLERVAAGDPDAIRSFAERVAPRVRRVARALMGRSLDADDAAQHALIEILRSHQQYRADEALERWVDRLTALSVLRFARAVRKRGAAARSGGSASLAVADQEERAGRTFEQYLRDLSHASREVLLLRHALGLRVVDLQEALRCSARTAKDRLLSARRELRGLVRRRTPLSRSESAVSERWCVLRDREAVEEQLSDAERGELVTLEAGEPEIWAYVAQVRALELYFAAHAESPRDEDHALVEAALPAVQVTPKAVLARALEGEDELDRVLDPDGGGWSRTVAYGGCALLVLACVAALLAREPGSVGPGRQAALAIPSGAASAAEDARAFRPTVEPLARASVARRGARLRRAGRLLPLGSALGQGDVVESGERAACLWIAGDTEACLAPTSTVRIASLRKRRPRVELVRGRLVVHAREASAAAAIEVRAGALLVQNEGGVVAVERAADEASVRVRALRGQSQLALGTNGSRTLESAHMAVFRVGEPSLGIAALSERAAQRDWTLLASASDPGPTSPTSSSAGRPSPSSQRRSGGSSPGAGVTAPGGAAPPASPADVEKSSAPAVALVTQAVGPAAAELDGADTQQADAELLPVSEASESAARARVEARRELDSTGAATAREQAVP